MMGSVYITFAKFKVDHRCFKSGDYFEFRDVNLLVGDQGCGKSTLIQSLLKAQSDKSVLDVGLSDFTVKNGCDTFFFDFEKDNPRIKDHNLFSNPDGTNRGIGVGAAIASKFKSHGEVLKCFSVEAICEAKNCIVFLDEPESALSLRNQFCLAREIRAAVGRGCQFFISTHCMPVIQEFGDLLSLEHRRWMSSDDFIDSQRVV